MSTQILKARMIYKVLVVGRNLSLQTGFLSQASGNLVSNQLYNSLGLSLGVAKYEDYDEFSIILQLWAIPQNERVAGLSQNFIKGHRAVIVVLRSEDLVELHNILSSLSLNIKSNTFVLVLGQSDDAELRVKEFIASSVETYQHSDAHEISDIIQIVAQRLTKRGQIEEDIPTIITLNEDRCPAYEPALQSSSEPESTDDEVDEIQRILLDQGVRMIGESCVVELTEGKALISLRSGIVKLEPKICDYCLNDCKRNTKLCIIAVDSGWSSQKIGQRALLTVAKIIALNERNIPNHVKMQIQRASFCGKFDPQSEIIESDDFLKLISADKRDLYGKKSLMEIALKRVEDGKLPESAYNMLKRKLHALEKSMKKK
ncbi:MAG: hypothetical protein JW779_11110 [Candidatus Thorarchaeota archaeon]|nr:hypothetical protein [Candidatus Thorarchaeota archaeon]